MHHDLGPMQAAYDRIATDYDARFSVHVEQPQRTLTRDLRLARGERCADLCCGTGVDTLEMLRLCEPGPMLAIDCSPAMLDSAQRRAAVAGLTLETRCQGADEFIRACDERSFDVISLRFCLGYLDWRSALPRLPRLLRRGGRIGILTILGSSAPQAQFVYREMAAELSRDEVPLTALSSHDQIAALLERGGAVLESAFTHSFRLMFESGADVAGFLRASGIATSPELDALPLALLEALWAEFATRIEAFGEPGGIPLDFHVAALVASMP
jgi:ubiquinone/menaquinone biosynthesis C-methylase UbiE